MIKEEITKGLFSEGRLGFSVQLKLVVHTIIRLPVLFYRVIVECFVILLAASFSRFSNKCCCSFANSRISSCSCGGNCFVMCVIFSMSSVSGVCSGSIPAALNTVSLGIFRALPIF